MASPPTTHGQQMHLPSDPKTMAAAQQPLYTEQPRLVPFSKNWHITAIVFRTFDLVFSIVIVGLAIYALVDLSDFLAAVVCVPPAGVAIIWETAEFVTLCARGGRLGIHPGAHVGVHLLIWLGWSTAVGFGATNITYWSHYYYYDEQLHVDVTATVLAFSCLLFIVHFTLFVGACVQTHRRNRARQTVYVVPGGPVYLANQQAMPPQPAFAYPPGAHQQPGMYQQQGAYPQGTYPYPAQQVRSSGNYSPYGAANMTASREQAPTSGSTSIANDNGPSVPPRQPSASPVDGSYYGPGNEFQHQRE